MKINILLLALLSLVAFQGIAQNNKIGTGLLSEDIGRRLEIAHRIDDNWHTDIRPWTRQDLTHRAIVVDSFEAFSGRFDHRLNYIFNDNTEHLGYTPERLNAVLKDERSSLKRFQKSKRPTFKSLYKTPANFLEVNEKDFYLRVNPLLNFDIIPSWKKDGTYFNNRRGLEIRGGLDGKIYFHTNIIESQSKFPNYVRNYINQNKAIPGSGFYKLHTSKIFNETEGHDYLQSTGYIGVQATRHFGLELGHGTHFIGNGIRSLLLSDFANNYFYLSFNTKIWKFQYKNIFAEMSPNTPRDIQGDELLVKKYYVAHYLSVNVGRNATFGFFESVSFARANQFEFQYLNPVIFYRTIEQGLGSPDNVLLGLNGKINIAKRLQLYGQLVMDEFKLSELSGDGWWANKFGLQAGLTYIDALGIDNAELTLEGNLVRPFTYAHRDSISNFAHANQALAHPRGSNFAEAILDFKYRPSNAWRISLRSHFMKYGEDGSDGISLGNNILTSTDRRFDDYGHEFLQGVQSTVLLSYFEVSHQVAHNVFVDFLASYRKQNSDNDVRDLTTIYAGVGMRINMGRRINAF